LSKKDPLLYEVATKIAGDIVMSKYPGKAMRRWRELFGISQVEIAAEMGVSASVISDYESGGRLSPGAKFVRRFVESLITIENLRGGSVINSLKRMLLGTEKLYEAVIDMREFSTGIPLEDFCEKINADLLVKAGGPTLIFGYTVVDSIKLVMSVPSYDYIRLYGATTQRAAIFTNVKYGRSPLVAVKAMQAGMGGLKPALVVLHGPKKVDELGLLIAKSEGISLALSKIPSVEELVERLRRIM